MKVKRTVEMDLLELLTWAKENGKTGDFYGVDDDYRVFISKHHGWVQTDNGKKIPKFETKFKVEQEVEIDEDMKLNLVDIYKEYENVLEVTFNKDISVKQLVESNKICGLDTLFIYLQNPDGSIGELIWSKERGLVD